MRALPLGQRAAYLPRGPVCDWQDEQVSWALRNALDRAARAQRAIALTYEPHHLPTEEVLARLAWLGLRPARPVQPRSTIVVDLQASPADLAARQKPKTRYNTRLAARRGVRVTPAEDAGEVRAWCELMALTAARDRFTAYPAAYYLDVWRSLRAAGRGTLFLARHEGRLLAGILVAAFGAEAIYLHGASGNEERHLMPNNLLQWEAMLWAREQGARRYDMWGIPDTDAADEPLRGVARFKVGWGGEVVRYAGAFDRVYRPRRYRLWTDVLPRARQLPAQARALLSLGRRPRHAEGPGSTGGKHAPSDELAGGEGDGDAN
jgi:lipid II:glycine glycyltransferase (peptidoglycan interpeptide bridge formation enzyme)